MNRTLISAGVLVLVWGAACSSPSPQAPRTVDIRGERTPIGELRGVVEALCDAEQAAATDPARARAVFLDRVHGPLHDIAAAAQGRDRMSAARLHEAKQAVEADLEETVAAQLESDLARLVTATRAALEELSVPTEGCDD